MSVLRSVAVLWCVLLAAACQPASDDTVPKVQQLWYPQEITSTFFSLPFPENGRLAVDDAAGILAFPNPATLTILADYKRTFAANFDGFGTNSGIFVVFDGSLDVRLPKTVTDTTTDDAEVYLIDIDPDSPDLGRRFPLALTYSEGPRPYRPAHTLAAVPYPGFVLRPDTTYMLGINTEIAGEDADLVAADGWLDRLEGDDARGYRQLLEQGVILNAPVAGAIFTTGVPQQRFVDAARYVQSQPDIAEVVLDDGPTTWIYGDGTRCYEYTGTVTMPNFQHGQRPYWTTGGSFKFDGATPVVAEYEDVRLVLRLPDVTTVDAAHAAAMPHVVYAHGTGGSAYSVRGIARQMCSRGIAAIGVDQPLHGPRLPEGEPSLLTFNLFNPVAMVHNFLQGGLESIALANAVDQFTIGADDSPYGVPVTLAGARSFMGHSQGALTGAYTLAAGPQHWASAVMSGSSGGLMLALLHKVEPVNFPIVLEAALSSYGSFSMFHPALTLFQTFAEPADPLNYGRYVLREAIDDASWAPTHVFLSEGIVDKYTPPVQAESYAQSLGLTWAGPELKAVEAYALAGQAKPEPLPISGNLSTKGQQYTAVTVQYPLGHFSVFDDATANRQFAEFLEDASFGEVPKVRP